MVPRVFWMNFVNVCLSPWCRSYLEMKCTIDAKSPAIIFSIIVAYCSSEFRRGIYQNWQKGVVKNIPWSTKENTVFDSILLLPGDLKSQQSGMRSHCAAKCSHVLQKLGSAQLGLGFKLWAPHSSTSLLRVYQGGMPTRTLFQSTQSDAMGS